MARCPECDAVIDTENDMGEGETLDCPECGAELEVVNTNPVEFEAVSSGDEEEEEGTW